jgi:hypothetical protein
MRTILVLLLAANLLVGAWIAWGDPQDGAHEPQRLARQVEPGRLRLLGDAEFKRARQKSQETGAPEVPAPVAVPAKP